MLNISPMTVAFITGPVVPFLVGLVTKSGASTRTKTIVNSFAALVVAAVANAVVPDTGVAVISWAGFANFVITALVSSAAYDSFWKPIAGLNDHLAPSKGIG